jgi:hypothetical protein
MRLRDLDARLLRREIRIEEWTRVLEGGGTELVVGPRVYLVTVETMTAADGIMYLCPKCYTANGGPVGTHSVLNWFVGRVPDDADPKPGRWVPAGTGIDDLTFVGPAAASVLLTSGCGWHGFVRAGDAS